MKKKTVKIDGQNVTVEKLPLKKYSELLKAVKELPKSVKQLEGVENSKIIEILPGLIGESLPDFVGILTIATPLKKEEIENLGLDEAVKLVLAVVEVNNYQEVYTMVKKATATQKTKG